MLGPLAAAAEGRSLPLGGPRQRTLLATLLAHANTAVGTERLREAVWGTTAPPSAQANVRSYVAALRKVLNRGPDDERLSLGHHGYRLHVGRDELDLYVFEDLAARGRAALARGDHREAAGRLEEALALWRGTPFEGVAHHDTLPLETARLEEARLAVLEDWAGARIALGEAREVVGTLRGEAARHPLRESLWARLMTAQYRAGRTADALHSYARARAALRAELGLEPGEELRRLHHAVLNRAPVPGTPPPSAPVAQAAAEWRPMSQLPTDATDFVGREHLLAEAAALLDPSGPARAGATCAVPVAVLTGLPGVGKTTLATRLAHELRDVFPDGRLFVHLDGARGPGRSPAAVLADLLLSLGVPGSSVPEAGADRAALFRSLLSGRRVLVLLDDARDEAQIRPLLPGTPGSAALVTSRARLTGLDGARLLDVEPFGPGEAQDLLRRLVGPRRLAAEPEATERVLAGCAGLPLALRVTGARLAGRPHWRIRRLADRLADERGRLTELTVGDLAVRSCVATSYHGLEPGAARAFRAVGLLPSPEFPGWALGALLDCRDPEPVTGALLDANLLQVACVNAHGQPRYRMHDLLHVYAAERVRAEEDPAWRRQALERVLDGWLERLRAARDQLVRGRARPAAGAPGAEDTADQGGDLVGWLEAERHALVTGTEFAAAEGFGEQTAGLAAALEEVCHLLNWWDEWERVARAALDRATADGDAVAAAVALGSLARSSAVRGRVGEAVSRWADAVERLDALGEAHHAARLRVHRSFAVADHGMAALAEEDARAAVAVLRRLGDEHGRVTALRSLAFALSCRGRGAEAVEVLSVALESAERLDRPLALADVLQMLGWVETGEGRFAEAGDHLRRALAGFGAVRHRPGEAYALLGLGRLHLTAGGAAAAARALGPLDRALAVFTELGERRGEALTLHWLGRAHTALGDSARGALLRAEAAGAFAALGMAFWAEEAETETGAEAEAGCYG
ncbi:SARP family transcriptional regulator [Streptomyces mashuensis]|uniref:SARP family transcriptional regulator n=1 Tax=Streptomyces mashuensis TaxID=33904 RepID=A0A919EFR8_9ACTN|nr:SARP family transcriptional regulator [Streptomyces mashuensis]